MIKTTLTKKADIKREWHLYDAKDAILGRLAAEISHKLMGKHKVDYTPTQEMGDYVVVKNAEKIAVTGNKEEDKIYYRHSRHVGNLRTRNVKQLRKHKPEEILRLAVKGMLPKNKLRDPRLSHLKIYAGENNPHEAQIGGKS